MFQGILPRNVLIDNFSGKPGLNAHFWKLRNCGTLEETTASPSGWIYVKSIIVTYRWKNFNQCSYGWDSPTWRDVAVIDRRKNWVNTD